MPNNYNFLFLIYKQLQNCAAQAHTNDYTERDNNMSGFMTRISKFDMLSIFADITRLVAICSKMILKFAL